MNSSQEIENRLNQVKRLISEKNNSEIKLNANGGNSILLVCPPNQEIEYIETAKKILGNEECVFVDINKLLIEFLDQYKEEIEQKFKLLQSSIQQIFKNSENSNENDFYKYILEEIKRILNESKIPVIYSVGTLNGTKIENIHIIENKTVMKAKLPIIILYPATQIDDKLLFLNSRPSSKYRCMIIE